MIQKQCKNKIKDKLKNKAKGKDRGRQKQERGKLLLPRQAKGDLYVHGHYRSRNQYKGKSNIKDMVNSLLQPMHSKALLGIHQLLVWEEWYAGEERLVIQKQYKNKNLIKVQNKVKDKPTDKFQKFLSMIILELLAPDLLGEPGTGTLLT